MNVTLPDGKVITDIPEGTTQGQLLRKLRANGYPAPPEWGESSPDERTRMQRLPETAKLASRDLLAGPMGLAKGVQEAVTGVPRLLARGYDALTGSNIAGPMNERAKARDVQFDAQYDGNTIAQGSRVAGNMLATAPVGPALGSVAMTVARQVPATAKLMAPLAESLATGGFRAGGATGLSGAAVRAAGGGATSAVSAGALNPDEAMAGGMIGAALPVGVSLAGGAGRAVGKALGVGQATPERAALAKRAKELGVDVPADRLVDKKALNAFTSGMEYMPFSGRQETVENMNRQLARAAAKTMGVVSDDLPAAVRQAESKLSAQFEQTFARDFEVDKPFKDAMAAALDDAQRLGATDVKYLGSYYRDFLEASKDGSIDGKALYYIKRKMDEAAKSGGTISSHARDFSKAILDGIERQLDKGPSVLGARGTVVADDGFGNLITAGEAFKLLRKRWGNMEDIATTVQQNSIDGKFSVARLANGKEYNADLKEVAQIAEAFVRQREGNHGAAQRAFGVGTLFGIAGLPAMAAGVASGAAGNAFLKSDMAKRLVTQGVRPNAFTSALASPSANPLLRGFPVGALATQD
jgi:hypothetical protein